MYHDSNDDILPSALCIYLYSFTEMFITIIISPAGWNSDISMINVFLNDVNLYAKESTIYHDICTPSCEGVLGI